MTQSSASELTNSILKSKNCNFARWQMGLLKDYHGNK